MAFLGFGEDKPAYMTAIFKFSNPSDYSTSNALQQYLEQIDELKGNFFLDNLGLRVDRIITIDLPKKKKDGLDERGLTKYFDYIIPEKPELDKIVGAVIRVYDPGFGDIGGHWNDYENAVGTMRTLPDILAVYQTNGSQLTDTKDIFNRLLNEGKITKSPIYFDEKELSKWEEEQAKLKAKQQADALKQQAMQTTDPALAKDLINRAKLLENQYVFGTGGTSANTSMDLSFLSNPMVIGGIGLLFIVLILAMKSR